MIDEFNPDRTGWARFSDDRKMRYRLSRAISERAKSFNAEPPVVELTTIFEPPSRVVFLMLNPSTADAFVLDPTIKKCVKFAQSWGHDVLEVVNCFALRSTDPKELYKYGHGSRGDDTINNTEILEACSGASCIVAGWGTHAKLGERGAVVRQLVRDAGFELQYLKLTKDGHPQHPLYIRDDQRPERWW